MMNANGGADAGAGAGATAATTADEQAALAVTNGSSDGPNGGDAGGGAGAGAAAGGSSGGVAKPALDEAQAGQPDVAAVAEVVRMRSLKTGLAQLRRAQAKSGAQEVQVVRHPRLGVWCVPPPPLPHSCRNGRLCRLLQ